MKKIGIRLADGSFYPIMEDGSPSSKKLGLTTVKDNQTKIIVDLYRSKSGTMEDAEYIDSLQIENLVAHPNGSMDIPLHIELDENNKLSAYIEDPETGARSDANITLVSRTLEERLEPTNYDIKIDSSEENKTADENDNENSDSEHKNKKIANNSGAAVAGIAAGAVGGGLLARMMAKRNESEQKTAEDNAFGEIKPEEKEEKTETGGNDFSENNSEETETPEFTTETDEIPGNTFPADSEISEDFSETFSETKDEIPENNISDETIFDELPDENVSDEATFDEIPNDSISDETIFDELPNDNISDETTEETSFEDEELEEPKEPSELQTEEISGEITEGTDENATAEFAAFDDDSKTFDIPDTENETRNDTDAFDFSEPEIEESTAENDTLDFDLPDFSDEPNESNEKENNEMKDENDDDFFNIPEDKTENSSQFDSAEHSEVAAGGLAFDDLYDKETKDGKSYEQNGGTEDGDEIKKKTKTPVIICIICAIICVIAVLLLLFVVPSKYNLLGKRKAETNVQPEENVYELQQEEIAEQDPIPEPEPETEAKEDEIVVITEPEIVETVEPEPIPEPETPKSITYKIKWGDTLWDIADAYYKNPWRYHTIARYNNIKNPDYIISGTTIEIPQN